MSSVLALRSVEFVEESEKVTGHRDASYWALKLAEETGEAIKAYNRYSGLSRRKGTLEEVGQELADVLYCAFILAEKLGINLDLEATVSFENVMTRGFTE